jgi:hypothetical protein
MNRRSFLKLSPAFPVGAMSAALVVHEDGKDDLELDVSVLKVQTGDILVLSTPKDLISCAEIENVSAILKQTFPTLQVVVLSNGWKLDGVIRS